MCGIVGYIGSQETAPILLEGLRRLEYRGYDSAGLAVHDGKSIEVVRSVGKLGNLAKALGEQPLSGKLGLGHTRWATHGRPNEANAHPHAVGNVALVHNGIIENHLQLREGLLEAGVVFTSETDTEIIAHLIDRALNGGAVTLLEAVRQTLRKLEGAYSIGVIARDAPDRLVVAKNASPLVIGIGEGEMLCASDIPALLDHTRDVLFMHDGELAELTASGVEIQTVEGEKVDRPVRRIDWSPVQAEKGGYKHFMLKEIFEQPRAIEDTLRGRVLLEHSDIEAAEIGVDEKTAKSIDRVVFVACGTSYHASLLGRHWVEQYARIPATAELASEVRYREPVFTPRDLVVAVSQSGETIDTLAAVQAAREGGATVLAVANVLESALPRASQGALYTHAGPEIGVASTKCFTTQLAALLMLAVYLGRRRETLDEARAGEILQALVEAPGDMRRALERKLQVHDVAKHFQHCNHMLFLGRGLGYPIALEGALKLKEISYAHAEGYAAGEMKHGPIALIDESMPVTVVMTRDSQFQKTASNVQEVQARDGEVIAVTTEGDAEAASLANYVMEVPVVHEAVLPLMTVLPLQLLSYYIADLKGTDVDQPRNLAKTVTVE
jgi:glutamine---fructose-6-phosphate transaminase (isomerizing)